GPFYSPNSRGMVPKVSFQKFAIPQLSLDGTLADVGKSVAAVLALHQNALQTTVKLESKHFGGGSEIS
ncbi:MAG TPA: hypothetical protein VFE62_03860, partial [Gemmataceae bacterium]|nr:hypothetical protein [Gemmataceae bacterium]